MAQAQHLLDGRTVIVTGAATGIGQAFAAGAAAQGANVVVADMNDAEETVAQVKAAGGQALAVQVNVADNDSVQAMAKAAMDRFGRIHGLVNNAAYFREVKLTPFEELDPAQWDRIFAVNVKGVWQCCKAVMPAMRAQNSGSIVNIASVVAVAGPQCSFQGQGGIGGAARRQDDGRAVQGVRAAPDADQRLEAPTARACR